MEFTPEEKRFLQHLGRIEVGRDLVALLKKTKAYYGSIASIDSSKPADAQIEGRRIFGEFIDTLTTTIETKERQLRPKPQDDFT